jgi:spermidine dehydrogenase
MDCKRKEAGDEALGLNTAIDRRDLLNSTLLAAGGVLLNAVSPLQLLAEEDWTGYGGVGDYSNSNGNTYEVMTAGHQVRDHVFDSKAAKGTDTGETFDCIIVGGGISGLAAALFFKHQAGPTKTCLVIDDHPIFGGEAKRNEFEVDGQRLMAHQGSAACFQPLPGTFLSEFYDSVGIDWSAFQYQTWSGAKRAMQL